MVNKYSILEPPLTCRQDIVRRQSAINEDSQCKNEEEQIDKSSTTKKIVVLQNVTVNRSTIGEKSKDQKQNESKTSSTDGDLSISYTTLVENITDLSNITDKVLTEFSDFASDDSIRDPCYSPSTNQVFVL